MYSGRSGQESGDDRYWSWLDESSDSDGEPGNSKAVGESRKSIFMTIGGVGRPFEVM
jgi:hypothetical protein